MAIRKTPAAAWVCVVACALVSVRTGRGQDAGLPFTRLFDTMSPAASPLASGVVAARTGWTELAEDDTTHRFQGDVVFVNNRIAVVVRKRGTGAEVYARDARGWRQRAVVLPVGRSGSSATALSSVRIVENTPSGIRLDCRYRTAAGHATIGYRLIPGDPGLEIHRGPGLARVRVDADVRYAVVPNYFGDDMVFSAGMTNATQLALPTEQLLLAMLGDGGAVMMCVCESDRQDCRIVLAGTGKKRRITGVTMQAAEGKRIWAAFMEDRGIWTAGPIQPSAEAFRWTPPFAARWRFDEIHPDGRATSSLYSKDVRSAAALPFLTYPLERNTDTPLTKFCMTDVMRNTLGVGPCQYIIAAEGLR